MQPLRTHFFQLKDINFSNLYHGLVHLFVYSCKCYGSYILCSELIETNSQTLLVNPLSQNMLYLLHQELGKTEKFTPLLWFFINNFFSSNDINTKLSDFHFLSKSWRYNCVGVRKQFASLNYNIIHWRFSKSW